MLLQGTRLIDLTRLLPGAYCSQLLQRQGAEIVIIEPPGGEPLAGFPAAGALLDYLYRGKERLRLDLRTAAGRDALLDQIDRSDVLLEGFRPGTMKRFNLGYEVLQARRRGLVYCAITGYGSRRESDASRAGHDLNYLARSGALSLMTGGDRLPMIPGIQIADLAGGLEAAFLIAAALVARGRTGNGARIEVSMTDLIRSWTLLPRAARRAGLSGLGLTGDFPCYRIYQVSDGWITVGALETKFWTNLCQAIDRKDLIARQFDPGAIADLSSIFAERSRAEWAARFNGLDVCVEPVLSLDESEAE